MSCWWPCCGENSYNLIKLNSDGQTEWTTVAGSTLDITDPRCGQFSVDTFNDVIYAVGVGMVTIPGGFVVERYFTSQISTGTGAIIDEQGPFSITQLGNASPFYYCLTDAVFIDDSNAYAVKPSYIDQFWLGEPTNKRLVKVSTTDPDTEAWSVTFPSNKPVVQKLRNRGIAVADGLVTLTYSNSATPFAGPVKYSKTDGSEVWSLDTTPLTSSPSLSGLSNSTFGAYSDGTNLWFMMGPSGSLTPFGHALHRCALSDGVADGVWEIPRATAGININDLSTYTTNGLPGFDVLVNSSGDAFVDGHKYLASTLSANNDTAPTEITWDTAPSNKIGAYTYFDSNENIIMGGATRWVMKLLTTNVPAWYVQYGPDVFNQSFGTTSSVVYNEIYQAGDYTYAGGPLATGSPQWFPGGA